MITIKETVADKIATTILGNYEVMDTMCSPHTGEWVSINGDKYEEDALVKMILNVLEAYDEGD